MSRVSLAGIVWACCAALSGRPAQGAAQFAGRFAHTVDARFGPLSAMAGTPDGFFWLGGPGGLWRSDGIHMDLFSVGLSQPPAVRRLLVTRDGTLWVATGTARLQLPAGPTIRAVGWRGTGAALWSRSISDGTLSPAPLTARLPDPWIWAMAEGDDGRLWLGTEKGLLAARPDGSEFELYSVDRGLPDPLVSGLAIAQQRVWVGTGKGLATIDAAGKVQTVLPGEAVTTLLALPSDVVVAGAQAGLWIFRPGAAVPQFVKNWGSSTIFAGPTGELWVATAEALQLLDVASGVVTATEESFDGVTSIAADRDGGVWVSSRNRGLVRFGPAPVRSLPEVLSEAVFSVLSARDGTLWVVTNLGISQFRGGKRERHFPVGPLIGYAPRSIVALDNGELLVAAGNLLRVTAKGVESFDMQRNGQQRSADVIARGAGDDVLVAWQDGAVTRFVDGDPTREAETITAADGICAGRVGPMLETEPGVWYLGSDTQGLGRWDMGTRQGRCLTTRDGLLSDEIGALYLSDGELLVGSNQPVGLARVVPGTARATSVATLGPVRNLRVFGINEHDGSLWLTSDNGVWVSRDPARRAGWRRLGVEDGLPADECIARYQPSVARGPDGRLYVPTVLGLGVIEPSLPPRPPLPLTMIESVKTGGSRVGARDAIMLPAGRGTLEVRLAAPDFSRGNRLAFETKLAGLDAEWVDRSASRDITYAGLSPGSYRFLARVVDRATGQEGHAVALPVIAFPFFWQRRWVQGAALVLAVLMMVGLFVLRGIRLRERYAAIADERGRIARDLHDGLAQGFTSIGLFVDSAVLELRKENAGGRAISILESAKAIVERCHLDVRQAVFNLRKPAADRVDVAASLARVINEAKAGHGEVKIELVVRNVPTRALADIGLEHELPMLVQEALANAIRHGGARHIVVAWEREAGSLHLRITDDGAGISDAALAARGSPKGGFGLVGMAERAARVHGTLTFGHVEPHGTVVHLNIEADPK